MKNALHVLSRSTLLALAALGALSTGLRAQEAAPASATETLPAAREIVDRYLEVTHAKSAIEKTKSSHMTGKVSLPGFGIEGQMEVWSAKPDRRKTKVNLGALGGEVLNGYDGKVAWMIHSMMGPRILKGSELLQTKVEAAYDGALKGAAQYESIETVGREKFEGQDCHKVKVVVRALDGMDAATTLEGRTSYEFYAVDSGLLVGSKGVQVSDMGNQPYTALVSDYKQFGEQLIATKTVLKLPGQEVVITADSVEFDTVTDDVFALPKEIQTLASGEAKPAPQGQ